MQKYLYLTKTEWAEPWINGGTVPLYVASKYRSEERSGIFTPDENLIDKSSHPLSALEPFIDVRGNGPIRINFSGNYDGARPLPQVFIDRTIEDGLVLCLANRRSRYIAKNLGKETCVVIKDVNYLKSVIDEQIGTKGLMGECNYTKGHQRNHFLKASDDAWQDEFRLFWKNAKSTNITLPKGIATHCFTLA